MRKYANVVTGFMMTMTQTMIIIAVLLLLFMLLLCSTDCSSDIIKTLRKIGLHVKSCKHGSRRTKWV